VKVLNTDEDVLESTKKVTYMIGTAGVDELHEAVVAAMRAATVGRDCFFDANDAAWRAIDDGLAFFKEPRTKTEVIDYMENTK
jgi:hypothetical protein